MILWVQKVLEIDFQALVSGEMVHSVAEVVIHNQSKVVTGVVEELLDEIEYKKHFHLHLLKSNC